MAGLTGHFAPTGEAQWRAAAERALKGGAFERLVSRIEDSIEIQPLYGRRTGPRLARTSGPWRVLARVDHPDPAAANLQALDDLANGADGLQIVFAGAGGAYGYGIGKADPESLQALLQGLFRAGGTIFELDLGPAAQERALNVAACFESAGLDLSAASLSFGLDPLGALARSGLASQAWEAAAGALAGMVVALSKRGFAGPFVAADGRLVHAAGGSPAQELGFALAAALQYLRALHAGGLTLEAASAAITFRLAADADEFLSLAKFRALRLLWARVEEACALPPRSARIHGETAWRMLTARDPWMNVVRSAMGAFCAGLGGADVVSVLPFTQALGLPDSFARRLARNAQLILLEESNLGFVADPAAGAGAFEALTEALCHKAWDLFRSLEGQGGLHAALERGDFQRAVGEVAAKRARNVARRTAPLLGVSIYPDLSEARIETLAVARPAFRYEGERRASPLEARRLAEPFETLRDAADAMLARRGARPAVFLANLGPIAAFGARADFAKGLFEAGGVAALGNDGFVGAGDAAAAFKASGAAIACLCSSDEIYAASGEEAASALGQAGAHVWMAVRPGEREAALRQAGVERFIFAGCDALEALRAAHGAQRNSG